MVRASSLGKRFNRAWVFRNVEFDVARGECMVITGSNGSGKSTLLRILAGLETKSEGECTAPNQIGFLAPDLNLYPTMTAVEHLRFAADLKGLNPDIPQILEGVGLRNVDRVPSASYSTGMRTRLKLAIATLANPDLLLLDEPGANLDDEGKLALQNAIANQLQRGSVILATNDERELKHAQLELRLA